jgi:3-hydroxyacyl-[acyl-carrier-protein] dehydratase
MSNRIKHITPTDIVRMLPHKPPAVMVDAVLELEPGARIVTRKNAAISEPCFQGHFPGLPSMPASAMLEIFIQTSCLLAMYTEKCKPASKFVTLVGVSDAKFHRMIQPGETIRVTSAIGQRHSNNWRFHAEAYVDDLIVGEALLSLSLVDRKDTL